MAPNSATLVFSTNKAGTVHWAISAVSDGSVSEKDLLEPPVYGGKILKAGTVKTASSNSEYTAQVNGLTPDGSYYVSAILVDGRDNRSPVKVAAFTTPDNTVPAFTSGYPVMTKTSVDLAQVTVMTNKSCRLYYALLPSGSTETSKISVPGRARPHGQRVQDRGRQRQFGLWLPERGEERHPSHPGERRQAG